MAVVFNNGTARREIRFTESDAVTIQRKIESQGTPLS